MGGGSQGLDALVLVDPDGKRRLVLPFGWGAGRLASQNKALGERYRDVLVGAVKSVEGERVRDGGRDFYEIAKTYF